MSVDVQHKWPIIQFVNFTNIRSLPGDEFQERMSELSSWLLNNLTVNDYSWSNALFGIHYNGEYNEYPAGVFFVEESDMIVFKLKFGL